METEVRINHQKEAEVITVRLSKEKTPIAFQKKLEELLSQGAFNTVAEAEEWIESNPFELELYYQKECGLFGLDPEAIACSCCYSPYTGTEMIPVDEDDDKDHIKEWVGKQLDTLREAMTSLSGTPYRCELATKTFVGNKVGSDFYLTKIEAYRHSGYYFLFETEDGDYSFFRIDDEGNFVENFEGEALEHSKKVFGYNAVVDVKTLIQTVGIALREEIQHRMNNYDQIISKL